MPKNSNKYLYCKKVDKLFVCNFKYEENGVEKLCGRTFNTKSNYQVHERIHTGEKPFKCHFCDKSFNSSSNRREHHRRHTLQKIYQCDHPGCDVSYHRYQQLVAHCQKAHGQVLQPKKDYGGRAKYDDINPNASDFSYEPIEDNTVAKPLFKVSIKRTRNPEGRLESLENSVEIKQKAVHTKTKYNYITQKFKIKKRERQDLSLIDDVFDNTLSEVDFNEKNFENADEIDQKLQVFTKNQHVVKESVLNNIEEESEQTQLLQEADDVEMDNMEIEEAKEDDPEDLEIAEEAQPILPAEQNYKHGQIVERDPAFLPTFQSYQLPKIFTSQDSQINTEQEMEYISSEKEQETKLLLNFLKEPKQKNGQPQASDINKNHLNEYLQMMRQNSLANNGQMSILQCLSEIEELQIDLNYFMADQYRLN